MKKHTVKKGEVLSDIARLYKFRDGGKQIINANPGLADLLKKNGNILREGWVLNIPDPQKKEQGAGTGERHKYAVPIKKKNLRIVLQDPGGKPVEDWEYRLMISGKKAANGKTGGDGRIDAQDIPQPALHGRLDVKETTFFGKYKFPPEKITLHIGDLSPIVDKSDISLKAVQKILRNLGYYKGRIDGDYGDKTRTALRAFQQDQGIEPAHGFADQKTCDALVKAQSNQVSQPKAPEKEGKENERDQPLSRGKKAERKSEQVTTRSEYLDPTWEDQTKRYTLGRFQFFPHEAYVAPADPGEEDKNTNVIRMPARKFLFLDTGHWQEDSRTFGVIWGRHAYLCEYLADGSGGKASNGSPGRGDPRPGLDTNFFKAMGDSVKVTAYASAQWATGADFDWNKLYVIIPDVHLMTAPIGDVWKPNPDSNRYDLQGEIDLLNFTMKLTETSSMADKVTVIQIGDSYDLWVGYEKCLFKENKTRKMELVEGKDTIPTLCQWIWDIQGRDKPWVMFALTRRTDAQLADDLEDKMDALDAKRLVEEVIDDDQARQRIKKEREELEREIARLVAQAKEKVKADIGEKAFAHVLVQENGKELWLNPAEAAFLLLDKTYTPDKGMIYIYGNHDNYLIDKGLCASAKIPPRRRYYEPLGVFMEHGHRLEATFFIGHPGSIYNYDGTRSGYKATIKAYHDMQKGRSRVGKAKKWAAGRWAQWADQPQYWGEFAQVWLGRKSRDQAGLMPPHIFVIGHTHLPVLYQIDINAWRIGGKEETPEGQTAPETLISLLLVFQRFSGIGGDDAQRGIANVPYKVWVNGQVSGSGVTGADGSVTVEFPEGATVALEILGSRYDLTVKDAIEPLASVKGYQRRLSLLGYELGGVDGSHGRRTDEAILNFQANNTLDIDGVVGSNTRNKLREQVGE